MDMIPTKHHFKMLFNKGMFPVYLLMISNIFSGRYFPITWATSSKPILFLIKVKILKKISTIATKNTKDENLLKNITTTISRIINTNKSIYIQPLLLYLHFIIVIKKLHYKRDEFMIEFHLLFLAS